MRPDPQDPAPGSDVRTPPKDSPADQEPPENHLCQRALSVPRTKTSKRFEDHVADAGPEVRTPPKLCHGRHTPDLKVRVQSALSVPRAKTSMRLGLGQATDGDDVRMPPKDVQEDHIVPFQ